MVDLSQLRAALDLAEDIDRTLPFYSQVAFRQIEAAARSWLSLLEGDYAEVPKDPWDYDP